MPARSKARKRALDILFEAEIKGEPPLDVLAERTAAGSPPVSGYAAELVRGVQAHRERIDELLAAHSQGWTLDRMPAVDRNILRIGVFELFWVPSVPDGVAISEAVLLGATMLVFRKAGYARAMSLGLMVSQRNMGLMLAATDGVLPGTTWLYFALSQFPIYITPHLLRPMARTKTMTA